MTEEKEQMIKQAFDKAFDKNFGEEIIIDGVDVAGCEYISDIDCSCIFVKNYYRTTTNPRCSQVKNCHYKQLKRLEQENKELKEKIIELSEEKGHLIVENNTLKESNQLLSMLGTDLVSANETVRKEFFRADKNKDMWREKAENYRSALEEIREKLKYWETYFCDNCPFQNKDGCDKGKKDIGENTCTSVHFIKIQDKINEVLNEQNSK